MSSHLGEDQMVALLHGTLAGAERSAAADHLRTCRGCADALAREAALDEVLREARSSVPPPPSRRPPGANAPVRWLVGGAVAMALAVGLGTVGAAGSAGMAGAGGNDMGDPLAWQNLIFYIPLAAGLLLIIGSAFTGHGSDGGAGHDHDAGHDHGHDHGHAGHDTHGHHAFGRALAILGVGRVPLTVALMTFFILFGGLGIIMNGILAAIGFAPGLYGPVSAVAALIYSVILSGQVAKLIARFLPSTESYLVTRRDFAGCTGMLLLPADTSSGYAQVKDREGNVHNVKCRTLGGALSKGEPILIIEYDEATRTYVVDTNPTV